MQKAGSDDGAGAGQPEEPPAAPPQVPTNSQRSFDSGSSGNGAEFQISLNDFLEFLKLSCHVNDMIAKADMGKPHNREPVPPMEGSGSSTSTSGKRNSKREDFDFDHLADNPLVNELLGLRRSSSRRSSSRTTDDSRSSLLLEARSGGLPRTGHNHGSRSSRTETSYRGLHPKLADKLDAVINEGVLDSVLSFICPVPFPTQLTTNAGRGNKPKQPTPKELFTLPAPSPIQTPASSPMPGTAAILPPGAAKSMMELGHSHTVLPAPSSSSPCLQQTHGSGTDTIHPNQITNSMVRALVKEPIPKPGAPPPARRKSLLLVKDSKNSRQEKKEPEVVIHVCDEVKNTSRDFTCPQHLLVSKMGYFADVTAGQRLEEMDISVHCDILIFDWLMKWIKHSAQCQELPGPGQSPGPQLDGNNVVPILVSASFLQMEPLLLECLAFCHAHLSEVVRTSTNLSCLNDALVTRLAAMFTNLELEMVRDKKERVTPRLWTKLIQSLCEPEPEALRGHFYSMSGLFRCARCFNCVTNTMKSYVNCLPSNIRLNRWGQLMSHHVRDSNWDLSAYIVQLFKELKSWRKVYWKLWGHCHYLYCCTCEAHFPVYQMHWCRFHPEAPNFLGPVGNAGPAGRYACCGQQAFRYETLPGPNGCQFREHSVLVETDRERAILAIAQLVGENYALCEPPPLRIQEMAAAGEICPSWQGISLTPQRCRQGLLPQLCMDSVLKRVTNHRVSRRMRGSRYQIDTSTDSETTSTSEDDARCLRPRARNVHDDDEDFSSSSDGCESDHRPPPRKVRGKKSRKRPTEVSGRFWSGELSARSNQDHQRDFEEKIMKQVASYVTKKTGTDQCLVQNAQPLGGTYVRLESEWKEMLKNRHSHHNLLSAAAGGMAMSQGSNTCLGSNIASGGSSMSVMSKQKHK
ncbi:uncharacterized protein Dana_GF24648 [Drosophila ananassae]|uniref:SANT and BTB domain-containing protein n=1 Tax=Drosophila ananassae TaxID=7217 RepID=B3MAQ6_DROAN|nr:uncharacterized protein KIAA1841 homolog [Drosophila ananassae]EDV39140.1 uncharacterized protein Dana_GF24648 [Drosophila ananassae]